MGANAISNSGSILADAASATLTTLVTFNGANGSTPDAGLIFDAKGNLLGTTASGGANVTGGTVFEVPKAGTGFASSPITLTSFNAASLLAIPAGSQGNLLTDAAGDLFGTTRLNGTSGDGSVFEIANTTTGYATTPTTLVNFNITNGQFPEAGLIADAAGNLYGTTTSGGVQGQGTVFAIAKTSTGYASTPTTLVSFNDATGSDLTGNLIMDANGDLFGTAGFGGTTEDGTVFEITKTSTGYATAPITLATFDFANGADPNGLIADGSGNLFGVTGGGGTNGDGTVFEIVKTSTGYASTPTTLVNFNGTNGSDPAGSLILDANGDLFGATQLGGTTNQGTLFEVARSGAGYASVPTTLVNFNGTNGQGPNGELIADGNGNLFGTTGGKSNGPATAGTVFEVTNTGFQLAPGLLGGLNVTQQLELVYVAYFNRSADDVGFGFWEGQNVQAQNSGVNISTAVTNIANAFAPQPETIALYPFLGQSNIDLSSPAGQTGLNNFVDAVYGNLFDRTADPAGAAYWVGQITTGAIGLGAAALAIANGATGPDAIEVQNKITVGLDFTNRTGAAGLGETTPLSPSFVSAAKNVLSGVDGTSLNDASVTAGESATTTFINGSTAGVTVPVTTGAAMASVASDPSVITVGVSNQLIDPGTGSHTIQFLPTASADTLMLPASGVDQVSDFDPGTDALDFSSLLSAAHIDLSGDVTTLGNYVTITDQGGAAVVQFDPTGHGGGSTVAVLQGLGTSVNTLIAHEVIRPV